MTNKYRTPPTEYRYWAFISYSHADEKWADWIHKSLETYAIPQKLVGKPTKYGPVPKRVFPIFRDRDELPSSADLGDKLTEALWHSRYLIVVCSPRSVASQWVNEEIKKFKSMGRENQVLCLIVDGEPYASYNPQLGLEECFPEPVRYRVDEDGRLTDVRTEPIAADARKGKDGKPNARLKVLSGMLGVNFSDLKQRDVERAQARLRKILMGIVILFLVFLMLSVQLFIEKEKAQAALEQSTRAYDLQLIAQQSMREQRDKAVESEQEAQEQRALAVKNAEEAKRNAVEAEEQRDIATGALAQAKEAAELARKRQIEAEEARQAAEANEKLANEQRALAVKAQAEAETNFERAEEESRRATRALSVSDFNEATRLIESGQEDVGLAYLSRSLDWRSDNTAAEARLISLFSEKNFSLPTMEPFAHGDKVGQVHYSADGSRLLTCAGGSAYLWDLKDGKQLAMLQHGAFVTDAEFSPDGAKVVTVSDDTFVKIWEAASGKPLLTNLKHDGSVKCVAFGPDGKKLITGGSDRNAIIWDAETGSKLASLPQAGVIWGVDFSPLGDKVVVAAENAAKLYNAASGQPLGLPLTHEGGVFAVTFSISGLYVATGSGDRTAKIWSAETGGPLSVPLAHNDALNSVHFSPDGSYLLTTSKDATARLWKVPTGEPVGEPIAHGLPVVHGAFSPNGLWFATASADRAARVFETGTGREIIQPARFADAVNMVAFSPNGHHLALASSDMTAQVWTCLASRPLNATLSHGAFRIQHASFSPNGRLVATASADRTARVWDVRTGEPVTPPLPHNKVVNYVVFSPDGKRVVSASEDGMVQIWDAANGSPVGAAIRHAGLVNQITYSPDGKWLLTSAQDRTAGIWNAETGEPRGGGVVRHVGRVRWASWSPDGTRFVTASEDRTAKIWDAATGRQLGGDLTHSMPVLHAEFSHAGDKVVTGSQDGTAKIWDVATSKPTVEPLRHDASVNWASFSPDDNMVVTASDDRTARAWLVATGLAAAEPMAHKGAVKEAVFSDDGQLLVTVGNESAAYVWETSSWKLATDPLSHDRTVYSATFSRDGSFVVTTSQDNTAKIWQIAVPGNTPDWMLSLVEAMGGYRLGKAGGAQLVSNPYSRISAVRDQISKAGEEDDYVRWAEWFLADRSKRPIAPYSDVTVPEFIKDQVEQATPEGLALALSLQPDSGFALSKVGMLSPDPTKADFYTGLAATYEPENPEVLWVRAAVLQSQNNFAGAYEFMQRAAKLDPKVVDTFGPEGSEFVLYNSGNGKSSGWLPKGWEDVNREATFSIVYTKLPDPPLGQATAIRMDLQEGARGRVDLNGARFIAPQQARMVIDGYIRGSAGATVTVAAKSFVGRPETFSNPTTIRMTEEWKPFSVSINPRKDIAAQIVVTVSSYGPTQVDLAAVRVHPQ